nr:protein RKD1-like [Ipomoea batatas]
MESPSSSLCNLEYEVHPPSLILLTAQFWDTPFGTVICSCQIVVSSDDTSVESSEVGEVTIVEDNSSKKEGRGRRPVPSTLSREVISSYFHMPVCQAAEELGIGETTLKERQDFEENSKDALTRATIGVLKNRHKLLSDMPGSNLDPETLCLRNAYFKLNYLKRKLKRAMISSSPSVSSSWTPISTAYIGTEGDEKDMDIPLKELLRRSKASPPSFVNVVTPVMIEGSTRSGTTSATRFYPNASSKRPTASATVTVIQGLASCVNGCPTGNASCDASCVMALGSARCWDGCIDSPEGVCVLPLLSVLRKSSFGRLPALRVTTMVLDNSNQEPKTKAKAFRFDPHRRRQCDAAAVDEERGDRDATPPFCSARKGEGEKELPSRRSTSLPQPPALHRYRLSTPRPHTHCRKGMDRGAAAQTTIDYCRHHDCREAFAESCCCTPSREEGDAGIRGAPC